MMKSVYIVLFLFFSLQAKAQSRCEFLFQLPSHQKTAVLGALRTNLEKPIVSQCVGTCYVEATASVIESKLSHYLNRPIFINRTSLFMSNLMNRLESLMNPEKSFVRSAMPSQRGLVDIVTSGSMREMEDVFNNRTIEYFTEPRTQAEVYRENKLLKHIHSKSSQFLYNLTREIDSSHVHSSEQSDEATRNVLENRVHDLISLLKSDEAIKNRPKGQRLRGLEFVLRSLPIHLQKKDGSSKPSLAPELEKDIINRLKNNGELELSYYHIKDYVGRKSGRDGFLELPEKGPYLTPEEVSRRKLGGRHVVALVDVLLNAEGRIEYFVVRNTWGAQGDTDRGYHYISIDYLTTIDRSLNSGYGQFHIFDWQIKEDF